MTIENRIMNGSFENNVFSPWSTNNAVITSLQSHSGFYAAQLTGGAANAYIVQSVPAVSGERFELLVSLSNGSMAPSAPISISVIFYGSGLSFLGYGTIINVPSGRVPDISNDNWVEIYQTTSEAPTGTIQAQVVINKLPQSGSPFIIVDDVALLTSEPASEAVNISDYAYIFNTGNQEVQLEEAIVFNTNGALSGIFHPIGTEQITIGNSGIYSVGFIVVGGEPNQFALFQNDTVVPGSIYGSEGVSQPNAGMVMIAAEEGDVLTIRNHTSLTSVSLQSPIGGSQPNNVNASIQIIRIRSLPVILPALETVNEAETSEQMRDAIEYPELGLNLTDYETLSEAGKDQVAEFILNNRPILGYNTVESVQDALDYAVLNVVDPFNIYVQEGAMDGNGSRANPYGTIEEGMAAVTEEGIVHILVGTYTIETQLVITKSLTLSGESDPLPQIVFSPANNLDGLIIQADNVTVENLHLISNRAVTGDNAIVKVPLRTLDNLYNNIRIISNIIEGTTRSGYIWAENISITDNEFIHNANNTQSLRFQMVRGTTNVTENTFAGNATSIGAVVFEPNIVSYTVSGTINVTGNRMNRFTQFVNFYALLEGLTSLYIENNSINHEDRSGSAIILTTRVDYDLVESLLIQNNTFINPHPTRLAVYFAGGGGGNNIPAEDQIQVYSNTFNFPNGYGQRPGDIVDPEFPVGYNAQAATFGMILDSFDLQNNVNV